MSKVILTCDITLDGLIESPVPVPYGGWLVMEGKHEDRHFGMFAEAAGMLLGRKSYEGFAAVWPDMAGDGRWADRLNPMPKYVASTTLRGPLTWNSTLIEGDTATEVRKLKAELDGDLVVSGVGSFARFLAEQGLLDEAWFWVHPTVQGPGERPFHQGAPIGFETLDVERFDSGITLLRLRPNTAR